jgi:hypothetical protein
MFSRVPVPSRLLRLEPLEDRTTPTPLPATLDPTFGTGGIVELHPDAPPQPGFATAPKVVGLPGG